MADKEELNEVEVPETENKQEDKVQYEVEGEENEKVEVASPTQAEEKTKQPEVKQEETPEELKGIETEGAQKRIRHLIRQRKERDEQIQQLIQQNENLKHSTTKQQQAQTLLFIKNIILDLEVLEKLRTGAVY